MPRSLPILLPLALLPLALLPLALLVACSGPDEHAAGTAVIVSGPPGAVPDTVTSLTGRAFDFVTGVPLADVFVSTFPPTQVIRTNGDGQYIVTERVIGGRV